MTSKIAYLGLGIMGSAMAANLAKNGHKVHGWNRTPGKPTVQQAADAGVRIEQSAADAVKDADFVFMCLGDEHDLHSVLLGRDPLTPHLKKSAIVIDTSTTGPEAARSVHAGLGAAGVQFLDAPVSGGDIGAKKGTLTIMVGGEREAFDECLPLFHAMGKNIHYCGASGSGQAVKLCNQILCGVNLVAVCEAFQAAEHMGISPELVVEVCSTGAAGSWALANLGPKIIHHDFAPAFMIKHMLKDLRLVHGSLGNMEKELPGTELAEKQLQRAQKIEGTNGGAQGTQAMIRAYRKI